VYLPSSVRRSGRTGPGQEPTSARDITKALGADGNGLFSQRVTNDKRALEEVIGKVSTLADVVTWAIDLHGSESALLTALLLDRGANDPVRARPDGEPGRQLLPRRG
jgi:hypothetical protein